MEGYERVQANCGTSGGTQSSGQREVKSEIIMIRNTRETATKREGREGT
jgi:hypothetical protein